MRKIRSKIATTALIVALASVAASAEETVEGITVHGHWTIEVRDEHGAVVERSEFENALTTDGGEMFTKLLARQETPSDWEIQVSSTAGLEVCEQPAGTPTGTCVISEQTSSITGNQYFNNLTLAVAPVAPFKLTFSGNIIAQRTGEIIQVGLFLRACSSATAPDACPGTPLASLVDAALVTNTILGVSVPVILGQQVLVTVELSFS